MMIKLQSQNIQKYQLGSQHYEENKSKSRATLLLANFDNDIANAVENMCSVYDVLLGVKPNTSLFD
jgi:hypothetical protein